MSSHTTYYCDNCNQDGDQGYDGPGVCAEGYPLSDGWAVFTVPVVSAGYKFEDEIHVCADCCADPDFEPHHTWEVRKWDDESLKNLADGRAAADRYVWAREHLGRQADFGWTGVRQVSPAASHPYGYEHGPRMEDSRFATWERPRVPVAAPSADENTEAHDG